MIAARGREPHISRDRGGGEGFNRQPNRHRCHSRCNGDAGSRRRHRLNSERLSVRRNSLQSRQSRARRQCEDY